MVVFRKVNFYTYPHIGSDMKFSPTLRISKTYFTSNINFWKKLHNTGKPFNQKVMRRKLLNITNKMKGIFCILEILLISNRFLDFYNYGSLNICSIERCKPKREKNILTWIKNLHINEGRTIYIMTHPYLG